MDTDVNLSGTEDPRAFAAAARPLDVRRVRRFWTHTRLALLVVLDAVAALWATSIASAGRYRLGLAELPATVAGSGRTVSYDAFSLFTVGVWLVMLASTRAYVGSKRLSLWEQAAAVARAAVGVVAVLGVVTMFARLQIARGFVLVSLVALVLLTVIGRIVVIVVFRLLMRMGIQTDRVLLVGPPSDVAELRDHLRRTSRQVRVVGELVPVGADVDSLCAQIRARCRASGVTSVIATDHAIPAGGSRELAAALHDQGVTTLVAPGTREVLGPSLHLHAVGDLLLLRVGTGHRALWQRLAKSTLDRLLAVVGLVALLPLMVAIALLVRSDGGPAMFRQVRVGRHGRAFRIWKFRTMCPDAEQRLHDEGLYDDYVANGFKLPPDRDPRITRIGRWLRSTSLDELPQLFNVLGGSMSLVGPRPVIPAELELYGDLRRAYVSLRPGVTGYWQANGRSEVGFPERGIIDSYYYDHQSLRLDVRILARTIGAVIARRGAQ